VLTINAGTIRHPEKLTRCRFAAGEAITELATGEYAFRSCFTSPFFTEIEFSVGTVKTAKLSLLVRTQSEGGLGASRDHARSSKLTRLRSIGAVAALSLGKKRTNLG